MVTSDAEEVGSAIFVMHASLVNLLLYRVSGRLAGVSTEVLCTLTTFMHMHANHSLGATLDHLLGV